MNSNISALMTSQVSLSGVETGIAERNWANQDLGEKIDFGALFKSVIDQVNSQQQTASGLQQAYQTGEIQDLSHVMLSVQKSSVLFNGLVEVRNRAVEAYQEVMRMGL